MGQQADGGFLAGGVSQGASEGQLGQGGLIEFGDKLLIRRRERGDGQITRRLRPWRRVHEQGVIMSNNVHMHGLALQVRQVAFLGQSVKPEKVIISPTTGGSGHQEENNNFEPIIRPKRWLRFGNGLFGAEGIQADGWP